MAKTEPDADITEVVIQGEFVAVKLRRAGTSPSVPAHLAHWVIETVSENALEGRSGFERVGTYAEGLERARELVTALDKAVGSLYRGLQKIVDQVAAAAQTYLDGLSPSKVEGSSSERGGSKPGP